MNRADLLNAEARAAVGRTLAGRAGDISVGEIRDAIGPQLSGAVGDFAIREALRASGWRSLSEGAYRREQPKTKPPRPRRLK